MFQKVWRYATLYTSLGVYRAAKTIRYKFVEQAEKYITFTKQSAAVSWRQLCEYGFDSKEKQGDILSFVAKGETLHPEHITTAADRYVQNYFILFGSEELLLPNIPWHADMQLHAKISTADYTFDPSCYYKQIVVPVCHDKIVGKDIKVPWELARFHFLPFLGSAYAQTGRDIYAEAAKRHILSWLNTNRFCYGIHWFNSMEVGIRAINWIIALQWLDKFFKGDTDFYQRLICCLYDHMRYIESNWEWYDGRTNNHYLANLVGYAFLCWFFKKMPAIEKKWNWCYKQILQEFQWQVFDEGTSYEGSTTYHILVTELFMYGFLIAHEMGYQISSDVKEKLKRMFIFTERCKLTEHHDPVIIGDNDSGYVCSRKLFYFEKLLSILEINMQNIRTRSAFSSYYKDFGLSLIRQHNWHISIRHHAYTKRQPTAHFHKDGGSVTLAYKGLPLVVDPGSYVYTASAVWRNYFRSAPIHNTVYSESKVYDEDLFNLSINENQDMKNDCFSTFIKINGGLIERSIICEVNRVCIIDRCILKKTTHVTWNFTFHNNVILVKKDNAWLCLLAHKKFYFFSSLAFSQNGSFTSPEYGVMYPTHCLQASHKVWQDVITHTFFSI